MDAIANGALLHGDDVVGVGDLHISCSGVVVPFEEVPSRQVQAGRTRGGDDLLEAPVVHPAVADEEELLELGLEEPAFKSKEDNAEGSTS